MLIQQRAASKYHCGRLWANSCCTHPHWGEALLPAAKRRIKEELGISIDLKPAGTITYSAPLGGGLTEHETVQIFHAQVDSADLRLSPDPREIMDIAWISRDAVQAAMNTKPEDFAPWFRIYLDRWPELQLAPFGSISDAHEMVC